MNYLDVSGCTSLSDLICCNNQLTGLDFDGCSSLEFIRCDQNQIKGEGMTTLVSSLPMRSADSPGTLRAIYDSDEGNIMTAAQIAVAKAKNWIPEHYIGNLDWEEYTGTPLGDLDGDGRITIGDVTDLIDMLLSGATVDANPAADMDGDGRITIGDVCDVIDMLLVN